MEGRWYEVGVAFCWGMCPLRATHLVDLQCQELDSCLSPCRGIQAAWPGGVPAWACPAIAHLERRTSAGQDWQYAYWWLPPQGRNTQTCLPISLEASSRQGPLRLNSPDSSLGFGSSSSINSSRLFLSSGLSSLICQVGIVTHSWWRRSCVTWRFGAHLLS